MDVTGPTLGINTPSVHYAARHADDARLSTSGGSGAAQRFNDVEHICSDHPKDAAVLESLNDFIAAYEYVQPDKTRSDRIVVYSRYGAVWRRGVIVAEQTA